MSYILDALEQADRQRQAGQDPELPNPTPALLARPVSRRQWPSWLLATVLAAGIAYWYGISASGRAPSPEPLQTAPTLAPVTAVPVAPARGPEAAGTDVAGTEVGSRESGERVAVVGEPAAPVAVVPLQGSLPLLPARFEQNLAGVSVVLEESIFPGQGPSRVAIIEDDVSPVPVAPGTPHSPGAPAEGALPSVVDRPPSATPEKSVGSEPAASPISSGSGDPAGVERPMVAEEDSRESAITPGSIAEAESTTPPPTEEGAADGTIGSEVAEATEVSPRINPFDPQRTKTPPGAPERRSTLADQSARIALPSRQQPQDSNRAPAGDDVIHWRQLPLDIQRSLPALKITVHIYSEQPPIRLLKINGQSVREGQLVAQGVKLERITRRGAVLTYKGREFLVTAS